MACTNLPPKIPSLIKNDTQPKDDGKKKTVLNCEKCDFKTFSLAQLNAHLSFAHEVQIDVQVSAERKSNDTYVCEQCEYTAKSATGLEAHVTFIH